MIFVPLLHYFKCKNSYSGNEYGLRYRMIPGKRTVPVNPRTFEPLVARRVVPVSSKIVLILDRLYREGEAEFLSLFSQSRDRSDIVATFLAVLELVKNRRLRIEGEGEDLEVTLVDGGKPH